MNRQCAVATVLLFCLACSGVAVECKEWSSLVDASAVSSVVPECFAQATSDNLTAIPNGAACSGITRDQASRLGTTVNSTACSGFSVDCLGNVTVDAFGGFGAGCTSHFWKSQKVRAEQALALSDEALGNMEEWTWINLINTYKDDLVDRLTAQKISLVTKDTRTSLRSLAPFGLYYRSFCNLTGDAASRLTWLQFMLTNESSWACLTSYDMQTISPSSFSGLTAGQMRTMPARLVAAIPYPALSFVDDTDNYVLMQLSRGSRLHALSVPNFNTLIPCLKALKDAAADVTVDQVCNYRESVAWPCEFVKGLSASVKKAFMCSASTVKFKTIYETDCGIAACTNASQYCPSPSSHSTSSSHHPPTKADPLSKLEIALIASLGAMILVVLILSVVLVLALVRAHSLRASFKSI